jgi:hypothetical protein
MAMQAKLSALAAAILASSATAQVVNACAMCGLGPNDRGGHAFNTSVLFMLAGPYVTLSVIGGALYYAWRRATRRETPSVKSGSVGVIRE